MQDDAARSPACARSEPGSAGRSNFARARSVLGCGGFEGNAEMQTRYIGPRSLYLRPVCRGGYYNKGEGIRMALDIGAAPCGDFGSYHAEPIDPRSGVAEPSVFIFSYGILVNSEGRRFTDEAPATVDACYERITRRIYEQTERHRLRRCSTRGTSDMPNYRLGIRTDQPPIAAPTHRGARRQARHSGRGAGGDRRRPTTRLPRRNVQAARARRARDQRRRRRRSRTGRVRSTSRRSTRIPVISSNVFTFGGLKVDGTRRVLDVDGEPIPGLYAAGETVGCITGTIRRDVGAEGRGVRSPRRRARGEAATLGRADGGG